MPAFIPVASRLNLTLISKPAFDPRTAPITKHKTTINRDGLLRAPPWLGKIKVREYAYRATSNARTALGNFALYY